MVLTGAELKKIQEIEVDMLRVFIDICEQLKLRYYVLGGTLLGAVRHKGFIPWDDDIDVGLPREDYDCFMEKAGEMLPEYLFLQNYETEPNYHANMAKIRNNNTAFIETSIKNSDIHHGVFIDIFPLDNVYESGWKKTWFAVKNKVLSVRIGEVFQKEKEDGFLKKTAKKLLRVFFPTLHDAVSTREKLYKSAPYTGILTNYTGDFFGREAMPASWFAEGQVMVFENVEVCAPKEYHKYLTQLYGDYLQLPPKEKRISHHLTEVIDLKQSYKNYLNRK